jgi:hypothetical protein
LHEVLANQQADSVDDAWLDFFVENDLAFNAANSDSYKRLNSTLMGAPKGSKAPTAWKLSNALLDKAAKRTLREDA